MTTKLEQAARALLAHWDTPAWKYLKPTGDLMADLREALAEQVEQEPVAWKRESDGALFSFEVYDGLTPLYTAHVRTKDLTDEEILESVGIRYAEPHTKHRILKDARAVIQEFRRKNK